MNKGYLTAKTNKESDEWLTPPSAVKPIIKYIPKNSTVWCPFDKESSAFSLYFNHKGYNVISSHIDSGENFFFFEPKEDYDFIISNPPFSIKDKILCRLNELNKPYAILMPINVLQGQKRFKYLKNKQALIFDKRINYINPITHQIQKGVSFASIYLCNQVLPKSLIFEELEEDSIGN